MNKPLDAAYVAALRRKSFVPPEIYAYPAAARRDVDLTLPPAPVLIESVEPGLELGDVLCIVAAVGGVGVRRGNGNVTWARRNHE